MGAVYLATRDDDQFQKQVAIKTLKFEMLDSASLQRFKQERQILASLDHPNVARLLDGGATAEGTPYLVMDFVEGVPITSECSQQNLSQAARVRLFRQVCNAVHFTHQN
jgi:serine/threonine protein kinase